MDCGFHSGQEVRTTMKTLTCFACKTKTSENTTLVIIGQHKEKYICICKDCAKDAIDLINEKEKE